MFGQTELKFAVDELSKPTVVGGFGATGQPSTYETIYFDTDTLDLRRHHIELSLRRNDVETVQTIKALAPNGEAVTLQRHEIELDDLQPRIGARNLVHAQTRSSV